MKKKNEGLYMKTKIVMLHDDNLLNISNLVTLKKYI